LSPVCAPYATKEALIEKAQAVAIDKKIPFLIGTTIE